MLGKLTALRQRREALYNQWEETDKRITKPTRKQSVRYQRPGQAAEFTQNEIPSVPSISY